MSQLLPNLLLPAGDDSDFIPLSLPSGEGATEEFRVQWNGMRSELQKLRDGRQEISSSLPALSTVYQNLGPAVNELISETALLFSTLLLMHPGCCLRGAHMPEWPSFLSPAFLIRFVSPAPPPIPPYPASSSFQLDILLRSVHVPWPRMPRLDRLKNQCLEIRGRVRKPLQQLCYLIRCKG